VDTGFGVGDEISGFYDSLIAKVIVHAETREEAVQKLRLALLDFHILGVKTNIGFLIDVIDHAQFNAGIVDTGFLGREFSDWAVPAPPAELGDLIKFAERNPGDRLVEQGSQRRSVWESTLGFRN
jgi:acetyl/propionyl-CoA carboxylase alpha subunit